MRALAVLGFAAFLVLVGRNPDAYIGAAIWLIVFTPYLLKQLRGALR